MEHMISLEGGVGVIGVVGSGGGAGINGSAAGGGGGNGTAAEEWALPSEAFEQRHEILESGSRGAEDQLLVDEAGGADQAPVLVDFFFLTLLVLFDIAE